jgi:branched-chain amino acid transport system permease protein
VVDFFILDSIVYGCLYALMALGLTLTYITTKVPNFAYGSFVTMGIYTAWSLNVLYHVSPYSSAIIAFGLTGLGSIAMYLGILRTLARRGSSLVALMIATLAIDIAFTGALGIYTEYFNLRYGIVATFFYSLKDPLSFSGVPGLISFPALPGLIFIAPISVVLTTFALFVLLNRTRFGIAMRASVENPGLARVLGINVEQMYVFAWFLAGGFAGLSGSYYSLWLPGSPDAGSRLIVAIFAASVLGGLASVYGAVLGGLIIGLSEILVTNEAVNLFGNGVALYQKGIPLLIMIATLLLLPQGLVSLNWRGPLRALLDDLRKLID